MKRTIISILTVLALAAFVLTPHAFADEVLQELDISEGNIVITDEGYSVGRLTGEDITPYEGDYKITGNSRENIIVITDAGDVNITFDSLDISLYDGDSPLIIISGSNVTLTLSDKGRGSNMLTDYRTEEKIPRIYIEEDSSLDIGGDGILIVYACDRLGSDAVKGGTLGINGGEIYLVAGRGTDEAGFSFTGSELTLSGGKLYCYRGDEYKTIYGKIDAETASFTGGFLNDDDASLAATPRLTQAKEVGCTYVELERIDDLLYRMDDGRWQVSPLFKDLEPGSVHTFSQVRVLGKIYYLEPSDNLSVTVTEHKLVHESLGDGTHSVACESCGEEFDPEECSGGKATVFGKAVCEVCGGEYGESTADNTPPTGWLTMDEDNEWGTFSPAITYDIYSDEAVEMTVTADDDSYQRDGYDPELHSVKIEYYIYTGDKVIATPEELDETVQKDGGYILYEDGISLPDEGRFVVYVKLTDFAGNSYYISSQGLVLDFTDPVIQGVEDGKTYCEGRTFKVIDDNLDTVTINGEEVQPVNGIYTLANGENEITATDKLGHTVTIKVATDGKHEFGPWSSNGNGTHSRTCVKENCGTKQTQDCYGGNATCASPAVCSICGHTYAGIGGHPSLERVPAKAPTHTKAGNKEYFHCAICGGYYADRAGTIPVDPADMALAPVSYHTVSGGWRYDDAAHWHICVQGEQIDIAGHDFVWVVAAEPTETMAGWGHEECIICGYTREAVEIPALEREPTDEPGEPAQGAPRLDKNLILPVVGGFAALALLVGVVRISRRKKSNDTRRPTEE